jgi:hypothetical protein
VTSRGVRPTILDRAAGLKPTSPRIEEVGTLVISLAARTAKRPAARRLTGGCPAWRRGGGRRSTNRVVTRVGDFIIYRGKDFVKVVIWER